MGDNQIIYEFVCSMFCLPVKAKGKGNYIIKLQAKIKDRWTLRLVNIHLPISDPK